MSRVYLGEGGYLSLLKDVATNGSDIPDRTGVGCRALFDAKLIWNEGEFPFFTHRPVFQRPAFEEFWFMLRGKTQTKELEQIGVNFWKGNTSREFLDARGLTDLPEGDMGQAYGYQWRNFSGTTDTLGFDQFNNLINGLKNEKYGRRHLVSLWNPKQSEDMALTPCWWSSQFIVLPSEDGDVLHMKLFNRSVDLPFGLVYAVQQYRMFQMALCKMFGFKLGRMSCDMSHIHIYQNQMDWVEELLEREYQPTHQNTIGLTSDVKTSEDLLNLTFDSWIINYSDYNKEAFKTPKPEMAA